jgi:DNA-binding transcriptional ArsR family regulator
MRTGPGWRAEGMPNADPFDALGDPTRREILRLLSAGDKPVHEIAAALPISRPAVSRHLRLLKDAGLVAERAEGNRRIYQLQDGGVRAVQEYLAGVWGEAAARFRLLAENTAPPAQRTTRSTSGRRGSGPGGRAITR